MKCLTNFINKDNSSKPWNRFSQFTLFIDAKKNMAISMKDHRFNRAGDCAMSLLYHLDDIALYLEKYRAVLNDIAILDRGFLEMDVLKPIYTAVALMGLHVSRPFHQFIIDPSTNYTALLKMFKQLYQDVTTVKPEELLTKDHLLNFVPKEKFEQAIPKSCLLEKIFETAVEFQEPVCKMLEL
jgi:hypothetical protein